MIQIGSAKHLKALKSLQEVLSASDNSPRSSWIKKTTSSLDAAGWKLAGFWVVHPSLRDTMRLSTFLKKDSLNWMKIYVELTYRGKRMHLQYLSFTNYRSLVLQHGAKVIPQNTVAYPLELSPTASSWVKHSETEIPRWQLVEVVGAQPIYYEDGGHWTLSPQWRKKT